MSKYDTSNTTSQSAESINESSINNSDKEKQLQNLSVLKQFKKESLKKFKSMYKKQIKKYASERMIRSKTAPNI